MPLFSWSSASDEPFDLLVDVPIGDRGDVDRDREELARLEEVMADRPRKEAVKVARSRWLERNRAERSFPCGVVPHPEPKQGAVPAQEPKLNVLPMVRKPMQVIAAVLPFDLAFIREQEPAEIVEIGRLTRNSIREVDVVDRSGARIPEPAQETFEPPKMTVTILRWSNEGAPDEDRFAFRSVWLAWEAARRLMEARKG